MQIVQNFRRLEKPLSRRNMYPAVSLIFTIMRLCANMHSQSEHLLKINKRDGACVSSLHETISLFKGCFKTCNAVTSGISFCDKISIFSVPSAVHPFVRKFFSHYRISSETTGRFFSKLVWDVSLGILLCPPENGSGPSINMAAGSHLVWFSPLSHLRNNWRNFVETLHMNSSKCLNVSARKWFRSVKKKKKKKKKLIYLFIALSCQESYLELKIFE